ncbi:hypothetical protein CVT25_006693 [Psilocybe cyanescens]|uniref:Uncharacterized protein n=1 Tax=Psilocybe cyanescens TaxID=93625 RepID=A0A409XIP8_PSICY|nr:hypothetical protein CVT25_006693 [Psilocybe cyanescens]
MPPKASKNTSASPKSTFKLCRGTWKCAASSVNVTLEPPAKKVATGEGEGEEEVEEVRSSPVHSKAKIARIAKKAAISSGKSKATGKKADMAAQSGIAGPAHLTITEKILQDGGVAAAPSAKPVTLQALAYILWWYIMIIL